MARLGLDTDPSRLARRELETLLAAVPGVVGTAPAGFFDALERYVTLLLEANRRVNLTRVTDPAEIARLHLLDALVALPVIDAAGPARVIDIGSGGGVPAIPLALARPQVEWVMLDSVAKKAAILREFVATFGIANATVLAERAETIGRDRAHRERYGMATARACAPLPVLAELALPMVELGGALLAWKGPLGQADSELRRGRVAIGQLGGGPVSVRPAGHAALGGHTFVVVPKREPTPVRFPRRPGEPSRRPLG